MANNAKEEIQEFLQSGKAGVTSDYDYGALKRAAESLFTANNLHCPVHVVKRGNQSFLINRNATATAQ